MMEHIKAKIPKKRKLAGRPRGDMQPKSEIALRLQQLTAGKRFRDIADIFGLDITSMRRYIVGEADPPMAVLNRICDYFRCTRDWLMTGHGPQWQDMVAEQVPSEGIRVPIAARVSATSPATCTFSTERFGNLLQIPLQVGYATVHGNGLAPVAPNGSNLLLWKGRDAKPGDLVAMRRIDETTTVGRFACDERDVWLSPVMADGSPPQRTDWAHVAEVWVVIGVIFG